MEVRQFPHLARKAFAAGYEVQSRLGIDCNDARKRGYLNLSMAGVLGIAAGAAKLLDFDVRVAERALAILASTLPLLAEEIWMSRKGLERGKGDTGSSAPLVWLGRYLK
jgi:2-methylcitrate dehydratase PrpD